ncbi:hypothetical protein NDU88_003941 [Pleurodeles waltl]|uniref:Uncharacterized protein n=1 Tax=Pleurodeles waltl TaxID=8319 RepID=A0AAV7NKS0_PLEWA|nr:hypothetical protein NDU88_003941 [Pleurodeles waltl]
MVPLCLYLIILFRNVFIFFALRSHRLLNITGNLGSTEEAGGRREWFLAAKNNEKSEKHSMGAGRKRRSEVQENETFEEAPEARSGHPIRFNPQPTHRAICLPGEAVNQAAETHGQDIGPPPHPGSQERYSPPRTTTKASEGTCSTSLAEGAAPYLFRAAEEEAHGPAHHTEPKRKRTRGRGGPETHTATQRTGSRQRRKLTLPGPRGGETRPGLQTAHIRTRRQGAQSKTKAPPTKRAGQQGARLDTSSPHATGNRKETATQLHRSLRTHRNNRGARKKSTYFRN